MAMTVSFLFRGLPAFWLLAVPAQSTPLLRGSQGTSGLCNPDIVTETCKLMDPNDFTHVNLVNVSTALSATHKATMKFWKALKFPKFVQHEPCQMFCEKLVKLLQESNVHLPDAHDMGCYEDTHGETHCDMELATENIANFVNHTEHDLHDYHAEEVEIESPPAGVGSGDDDDEGQKLDYTIEEMAVRVANIFRIYPELKFHLTDRTQQVATDSRDASNASFRYSFFGSSSSPQWKMQLQQVNQKAEAYVSYAIRKMMLGGTVSHLRTWFGPRLSTKDVAEVRRVLNSIDKMLGNVEYVYPGPQCKPRTYAYVYPTAYTCPMSLLSSRPCTRTSEGKFVFYMCELTMRSPLSEQIETLTHEGSHHAVAFTDDVTVPWGSSTAYGRSTCKQLAQRSTSLSLKNADNHCYFIQDVTDKR